MARPGVESPSLREVGSQIQPSNTSHQHHTDTPMQMWGSQGCLFSHCPFPPRAVPVGGSSLANLTCLLQSSASSLLPSETDLDPEPQTLIGGGYLVSPGRWEGRQEAVMGAQESYLSATPLCRGPCLHFLAALTFRKLLLIFMEICFPVIPTLLPQRSS